jgi:hypothetical protein
MLRQCVRISSLGFTLLSVTSTAWAQIAPPLGTAAAFGALGNSGIVGSAGLGTAVAGEVGSSPNPSVTNFPPSRTVPPFTVHTANDFVVQQARTDAIASYVALFNQGGAAINDNLSTVGILGPGVYALGAADLPNGTTLTLNDATGVGIFIFNVASSLTMNTNSVVAGTANPCNIYWRVGTSATLNGVIMLGTVIADASITLGSGNLVGRALAGTGATGAVTMPVGGNTIGGCSVAGAGVPTLSEWAMIALSALLALAGAIAMRRRRAQTRSHSSF